MSKSLKLYRISQGSNRGYDTYDSAVVCAASAEDASLIPPYEGMYGWVPPDQVFVYEVGIATNCVEGEVICASFNAG